MTIKEVIDYVNRVKKNEFTNEEKTRWINEIEGYVQIQIMLLAQPECISYCHASESEQRGVCFPSGGQMRLPRKISAHVGGLLTIEGLVTYEENNLSELEIQSISENGKVIGFAEGTFKQTGTTPESAIAQLQFDGQDTELLVPTPFDRLYYEYVLAKISENLEESSAQNNRLATFDETWQNFAEWYANTYRPADGKAAFKGYYITGKQGAPGPVGPPGKNAYNISISTSSSGISADKTYEEISAQIAAGVLIIPVVDGQSFNANTTVSGGKIIFTAAEDCGKPILKGFSVNANNEWSALSESLSTEAQTSAKYTKPANGIPKADLASGVQASLDKAENAVEYFEVALTVQGDSAVTADKTYAQVKAEVENGKRFLSISGISSFYILVKVTENAISFVNSDYRGVSYELVTVQQGDIWIVETVIAENTKNITEIYSNIGLLVNLNTDDKTNLVEAICEVKSNVNSLALSKVGKVAGKDLSTNDYTDADKAKVNNIPKKTSQLENDSEFVTAQAIAGKADTDTLAPVATSGSYSDLTDKPEIPSVPTATINANAAARHTHDNKTVLDAITDALKIAWSAASSWVTTNGADVLAHLTNTVKHITAAERTAWNAKQDKIIAGNNITIGADGKTISATGGGGGISGDNIETVEAAQVELPSKLSELENDTGFITADDIAGKQDTITDLATIRSGAAKGATALQSIPSSYRTATAQDAIDNALSDKVTAIEGKESGWNAKYDKPTGGIPKSDLAAAVQTSLDKANTALQSVPSTYRTANAQDAIDNAKVDKVTGKGLSANDYTDAAKAKVDAIPANPKYTDTVYDDTAVKSRISAVEGKLNGNGSASFANVTADSLTTKSQVEIYADQPHIDFHYGNSVDDYTSRIIETASGKLNFTAPNGVQINGATIDPGKLGIESITLSVASSRLSDLSYTAKYCALLNAVFVRIYGNVNTDMNVGYDYDVLNIGSRLPEANAALAVKCNKNAMAFAKSTGAISLRPLESGIKSYDIYIAGFWFV